MLVKVEGLRQLPKGGYYELLLTKDGKPVAVCGSFKVNPDGVTEVRLGASYDLRRFDGWVVRPYITAATGSTGRSCSGRSRT